MLYNLIKLLIGIVTGMKIMKTNNEKTNLSQNPNI
jgi:hypothetical protein